MKSSFHFCRERVVADCDAPFDVAPFDFALGKQGWRDERKTNWRRRKAEED
jgi:hypothetical protein